MTTRKTYTQTEAARFMGVSRQAVRARFHFTLRYGTPLCQEIDGTWCIPHAELVKWQKERQARAKKLLATGPK